MAKKSYFITGMHCIGCESFIERSVKEIKGINEAKVSLANSSITIVAETKQALPSRHGLNQLFKDNGYAFTEIQQKQKLNFRSFVPAFGISLLIIALFFMLERSHLLNFLYVDSGSYLIAYFLFGIAAGFSSCAALVGSLLLSVQKSWVNHQSRHNKGYFFPFLLFNSARIISFGILGGLLGMLGSFVQFSMEASAIFTILISVVIFIIGMQMLGVSLFQKIPLNIFGRWVNRMTNGSRFQINIVPILFGAITFFVPCGFTIIAQSQAIRAGNFIDGMIILLAFALGTLPVLLIISLSSINFTKNNRFSQTYRLLSGLLIVFFALYTVNSQIRLLDPSTLWRDNSQDLTATVEALNIDDQIQTMQMEARGFSYYPEVITIKSHLPTEFTIHSNGSIGCANAVYARGLYPDVIILNPGINIVEFIAPAPGTYQISCSMWMVDPITVIVE